MSQILHEWNRRAPRELEKRLAETGGRNRFAGPNFRIVWSEARMEWQGGRWNDFAKDGRWIRSVIATRRVPRYVPFVGWVIEAWQPPEYYGSPENWARRFREWVGGVVVETLGPYPQAGDYEEIFRFQGSLTPTICDAILHRTAASRRLGAQQRSELVEQRVQRRLQRWESFADDVLQDARQAFPGPFIGYGGSRRHSSVGFCERAGVRSHPF